MWLLLVVLVEGRELNLDSGTGPAHDKQHEFEKFEDGISFCEGIVLEKLFGEGNFDFFEYLGAEDELYGGVGDGEYVFLWVRHGLPLDLCSSREFIILKVRAWMLRMLRHAWVGFFFSSLPKIQLPNEISPLSRLVRMR